jgi:hypothetical protein
MNRLIKEFHLGALKWDIIVNRKRLDKLKCNGYCEADKQLITLDQNTDNNLFAEQILYHEVVHGILDTMGEYELSNNEKFVKTFSVLLYQFEMTKK